MTEFDHSKTIAYETAEKFLRLLMEGKISTGFGTDIHKIFDIKEEDL